MYMYASWQGVLTLSLLISAADGRVVPLGRNGMQNLWEELKAWLRVLNAESEAFSGEALLSRLESLRALSNLVSSRPVVSNRPGTRVVSSRPGTRVVSSRPGTRVVSSRPGTRVVSSRPWLVVDPVHVWLVVDLVHVWLVDLVHVWLVVDPGTRVVSSRPGTRVVSRPVVSRPATRVVSSRPWLVVDPVHVWLVVDLVHVWLVWYTCGCITPGSAVYIHVEISHALYPYLRKLCMYMYVRTFTCVCAVDKQVEGWTEVALEVFSRHQEMNRFDHAPSDHTHSPEHQTMLSLNSDIGIAMKYCTARTTGDNGSG